MRRRFRDERFEADLAVLATMRRTATIDFVQWVDDEASRAVRVPERRIYRQGSWATLHDVSPEIVATLPTDLAERPISRIEVSVDLYPKLPEGAPGRLEQLSAAYEVLHRRLAPWGAPGMSYRMYRTNKQGRWSGQTLIPKERVNRGRGGATWHRLTKDVSIWPAVVRPDGTIVAHTIYFGHKVPRDGWKGRRMRAPHAQVRLYIKTTDNRRALDPKEWRVRAEVTLNGFAARQALGAEVLGDLQQGTFRKLASSYLRLAQPVAFARRWARRSGGTALVRLIKAREVKVGRADAQAAVERGNFAVADFGAVNFKTNPELNKHVAVPLHDLARAIRRAVGPTAIASS